MAQDHSGFCGEAWACLELTKNRVILLTVKLIWNASVEVLDWPMLRSAKVLRLLTGQLAVTGGTNRVNTPAKKVPLSDGEVYIGEVYLNQ